MKSIATGLPWLLPTGTVVSLLDSEPEASKFEPNVDLQTLPGDVPSRLAHPSFYGQCGERRPRERERKMFPHRKLTYYVLSRIDHQKVELCRFHCSMLL